jgi:hypothetical protein
MNEEFSSFTILGVCACTAKSTQQLAAQISTSWTVILGAGSKSANDSHKRALIVDNRTSHSLYLNIKKRNLVVGISSKSINKTRKIKLSSYCLMLSLLDSCHFINIYLLYTITQNNKKGEYYSPKLFLLQFLLFFISYCFS